MCQANAIVGWCFTSIRHYCKLFGANYSKKKYQNIWFWYYYNSFYSLSQLQDLKNYFQNFAIHISCLFYLQIFDFDFDFVPTLQQSNTSAYTWFRVSLFTSTIDINRNAIAKSSMIRMKIMANMRIRKRYRFLCSAFDWRDTEWHGNCFHFLDQSKNALPTASNSLSAFFHIPPIVFIYIPWNVTSTILQ